MAMASIPGGSGYPVQITFDRGQAVNRLWGVPILGLALRWFLLIPHWLIVTLLTSLTAYTLLVSWIPILLLGRLPRWFSTLYVTTYRWTTRTTAYGLLMTGPYPPFSLNTPYPADLIVTPGEHLNRLWGIPLLGLMTRAVLVFPQLIVLGVLSIAIYFAMLVIWIPVLLNGRFPQLGYDLFGGYLRLVVRASLWTLLMPLPYPPITPGE